MHFSRLLGPALAVSALFGSFGGPLGLATAKLVRARACNRLALGDFNNGLRFDKAVRCYNAYVLRTLGSWGLPQLHARAWFSSYVRDRENIMAELGLKRSRINRDPGLRERRGNAPFIVESLGLYLLGCKTGTEPYACVSEIRRD